MKPKGGFSWRRATGVYYARGRLVIAAASVGLSGRKDVRVDEFEVAREDLPGKLEALREQGLIRGPVLCGLDPRKVFSLTRRFSEDDRSRGAAELLKEQVGPVVGGIATALLPLKLTSGAFHAVYACEGETATALLEGLGPMRESQRRCVPVVDALLPALTSAARPKRSWRTWVGLVPGAWYGLAVLVHGGQVVATRLFASRGGKLDLPAAEAALHGLRVHARDELQLSGIAAAVVTGKDGDAAEQSADALTARLEGQFDLHVKAAPTGFSLDDPMLASTLARLALVGTHQPIDLFTELTSVRTAWDHVPTRPLMTVAAAAFLCAGILWWQASGMESAAAQTRKRAKSFAAKASVGLKQLAESNKALKKEVNLVHAFTVRRVFWEDFMREIPELLPPTMFMTRLDGRNPVRWSDRSRAETKLTITAEIPLLIIDGTPPEVTEFTEGLSNSELFREQMSEINGANVRFQAGLRESLAKLVILCAPK